MWTLVLASSINQPLEVGSSWVFCHGAHSHSDSEFQLLYLELEDQLGSVLKFSLVLFFLSRPSVLATASRDAGYNPTGLKLLNDIGSSGHRNIKLFGDGLVTFSLTDYYLVSNLFRPPSAFPPVFHV